MLSDAEMFDRMKNGWRMGRPFTECGNGSTLDATENIRRWLPKMAEKYRIRHINDAGAGDMAWWPHVRWIRRIDYTPYDLIPRRADVQQIDITTEAMGLADAILCRMVLNHLDPERVSMALWLFKQSARYLIATQFDKDKLRDQSKEFTRLDLNDWLGKPLEQTPDGQEQGCRLAIWAL